MLPAPPLPRLEYVREPAVSAALDGELCALIRRLNHRTQTIEVSPLDNVLYKPLTAQPWPPGPVDLRGPLF
jgi:hypothetical protein